MQALTLISLMRSLGAGQFGQFAAITSASAVVVVIVGLGLNSLALRVSALDDPREVSATIAMLRIPVAFGSAGIVYVATSMLYGSGTSTLFFVAGLYAASESIGQGVEALLYGNSREVRAQATLLIRRGILLVGVLTGSILGNQLPWFGASIAIVLFFLLFPLRGTLGRPAAIKRVIRLATPLWAPTVLAQLQSLDVVVAAIALPATDAGLYAAATRVTSPLNTVAVATLSILTPRLSAQTDNASKNELFGRTLRGMGFTTLGLCALSPAVGGLTELVLGGSYQGVFWPATILTCMTAVAALTQVYVSLFYSRGDGSTVAKIRVVVVPVSLIVGWLLATLVGPIGLAASILASQLALLTGLALASSRRNGRV